jgi:hypothetical protein
VMFVTGKDTSCAMSKTEGKNNGQQNTRLGLDLKRIVGWPQRDRHRSITENGASWL